MCDTLVVDAAALEASARRLQKTAYDLAEVEVTRFTRSGMGEPDLQEASSTFAETWRWQLTSVASAVDDLWHHLGRALLAYAERDAALAHLPSGPVAE